MHERVVEVMSKVLGLERTEISEHTVIGQTNNWDSLTHMNLIIALEEEFNVTLSDDEVVHMVSMPLICRILSSRVTD